MSYGYVAARLRAMELRFLDNSVMLRMLESDDDAAMVKILSETAYGAALANAKNQNFDTLLENELLYTYKEIEAFVPQKELVTLSRMTYDFHNVKVLLKSSFSVKSGGAKRWDLLTSLGSIPVDVLIQKIEGEEYTLLPFGLNIAVPACIQAWEQTKDVLEVERMLDKQYFTAAVEAAKKLEHEGIVKWIKDRIDSENLRTILRLRRFGFDAARTAAFLHEGGSLSNAVLLGLLGEPLESWSRLLSFSDYAKVTAVFSDLADDEEAFGLFEKALDDKGKEFWEYYRHKSAAVENVPAFLWRKEMEIKNLRMIYVSNASRMDGDFTRRLLRNG